MAIYEGNIAPFEPVEIDKSHQRSNGLLIDYSACGVSVGQNQIINLADGNAIAYSNGAAPAWVATTKGMALSTPTTSYFLRLAANYEYAGVGGLTIAALAYWSTIPAISQFGQQKILEISDATDTVGLVISLNNPNVATTTTPNAFYSLNMSGGTNPNIYGATSLNAKTWYMIVGTTVGTSTHTLYVNAVSDGTSANSVGTTLTVWDRHSINGFGSSGVNVASMIIQYARLWNRALSLAEIQNMYQQPWAHLRPKNPRTAMLPPLRFYDMQPLWSPVLAQ